MSDNDNITHYTIDPAPDGDGFWLHAWGTYGRGSILEGQPLKRKAAFRDTAAELQAHCKENGIDAETLDETTYTPVAHVPDTPPHWFDPGFAGEEW